MTNPSIPTWIRNWQDYTEFPAAELAHALSGINRFCARSPISFSVARHSLLVSDLMPDTPRMKLLGLIHDCHEMFTGDLPRPLVEAVGDAIKAEQAKIDRHLFGLIGFEPTAEELAALAVADRAACDYEMIALESDSSVIQRLPVRSSFFWSQARHVDARDWRGCFEYLLKVVNE